MNISKEVLETKIKVPKTFEEQLEQLIEGLNLYYKTGQYTLKSDALIQMFKNGELNYSFIVKEGENIIDKKSLLSASKRAAVSLIIKTAINLFEKKSKNFCAVKDEILNNNK